MTALTLLIGSLAIALTLVCWALYEFSEAMGPWGETDEPPSTMTEAYLRASHDTKGDAA